jgi:hypothetical protein
MKLSLSKIYSIFFIEIHPACIKTVQVRCIRSRGRKGKLCKVKNAEMIRSVQLMYSHGNHRNHRNRGQPKCILNVNLFLSKKGNKFVIKRRCSGTFRVTYEGKGNINYCVLISALKYLDI